MVGSRAICSGALCKDATTIQVARDPSSSFQRRDDQVIVRNHSPQMLIGSSTHLQ